MTVLRVNTPLLESLPEFGMIAAKDYDEVRPSFGKDLACVPVKDDTASCYYRLQFIN